MREQRPEIAENVASIDRIVHEPARLAVLTVLAACERADFLFLEKITGLTRGNLSAQMTRLEEAGLIDIEKTIERKRTLTTASLKVGGRRALDAYWKRMEQLREMARHSIRDAEVAKGRSVPGPVAPACG